MGCVQSQPQSRRRSNKSRGSRGRKGGRKPKRQETSESGTETESESESDSERRRKKTKRATKNRRRHEDSDASADDKPEKADQGQQHIVVDRSQYAKTYPPVSDEDLNILWYSARTCHQFDPKPVPHEFLRNGLKLAILAPSAYNCCPLRVVFCTTGPAKTKLLSCVDAENKAACESAPVTAIVCSDLNYTHHLPKLMPYVPNAQQMFEQYDDLNEMIRIRNTNLQVGYLIIAFRALGLATGPIGGFNNEQVDEMFLVNDPTKNSWKSILLLNIGYEHPDFQPEERAYRLPFDVAAKLL